MWNKISLRKKLVTAFIVFGVLPALILALMSMKVFRVVETNISKELEKEAATVADLVDRNLFERYGDVQAFGLNLAVFDKDSWYQHGSGVNKISKVMNDYAYTYGFYKLTLLVDLEGRVVAVNDKSPKGEPVDTEFIYSLNFAKADWFKDAIAENFYTGEGLLSGTVVNDFVADELVSKIYNDEGFGVVFTAPVRDSGGNIIAVWRNFADLSLVDEILISTYKKLAAGGKTSADLMVINKDGLVISQFDPTVHKVDSYVRNSKVVGAENLLDRHFGPAHSLAKGESGSTRIKNEKDGEYETVGYFSNKGVLGFKGMPWGVIIKDKESEVFAEMTEAEIWFGIVLIGSTLVILALSNLLVRRIVNPVDRIISGLTKSSSSVRSSASDLENSGHALAEGASEQAAAIQETVASMAEMTSMIAQTSEGARLSLMGAQQMAEQAEAGAKIMERMVTAMEAIHQANGQLQNMANIINEISSKTAVINDIVFKTQLLSFNASIEAARAGQHGRGFAVVAEEVGNLAEMSGAAAKEIQALLEDSKKQVSQIVDLTKSRVNEGQQVSKESLETFNGIAKEIRTVSSQIESINNATREQETGVQQTNAAMSQMDQVAQKNSRAAADASNSARGLAGESKRLDRTISSLAEVVYGSGKVKEISAKTRASRSEQSTSIIELDTPIEPGDEADHGAGLVADLVAKKKETQKGTSNANGLSADDDSFKPMS